MIHSPKTNAHFTAQAGKTAFLRVARIGPGYARDSIRVELLPATGGTAAYVAHCSVFREVGWVPVWQQAVERASVPDTIDPAARRTLFRNLALATFDVLHGKEGGEVE
jgi:hypothetical protein